MALIQTIPTPDGAFTVLADDQQRVLAAGWTADHEAILGRVNPSIRPAKVSLGDVAAVAAVVAYYAGDIAAIDTVPVHQHGTELQLQGWAALRRITPGSPLTYTEFAETLGRPSAVRAAAAICARNAPALFVPCHRVLRTDGTLGGFAWGIPVKERLLRLEASAKAGASRETAWA